MSQLQLHFCGTSSKSHATLNGVICAQLRLAAEAVGENNLASKFAAASESLRRGIMFANSLYL